MEAKRLGLCQKSLFVVPNHLTLQWAQEFLHLYPSAKLLVASKKDFETANRKKFCARIATLGTRNSRRYRFHLSGRSASSRNRSTRSRAALPS